jgi:hypothetical protein
LLVLDIGVLEKYADRRVAVGKEKPFKIGLAQICGFKQLKTKMFMQSADWHLYSGGTT